ncbi:MAG: RNA polymerase-binding protein RbpA [Actinomycetota bacterium]
MSDKTLRGSRLGAQSLENEHGVEAVARVKAEYVCPRGHVMTVPFAADIEIPIEWECTCGVRALLRDAQEPPKSELKPVRSHWDMLLERRSMAELELLLDERLALLRTGRNAVHRRSA